MLTLLGVKSSFYTGKFWSRRKVKSNKICLETNYFIEELLR